MTTFLLILQIVAGLFAAGAAVASLLKSKGIEEVKIQSVIIGGPETVVRRLTREAKIGIYCVSAGVIISFVARIIDQHLITKRNAEAQAVMFDQLRRTEESLNYLERLGTRFDTLKFSVTYRLNTNKNDFRFLLEFFSQAIPNGIVPVIDSRKLTSNPPPAKNWLSQIFSFSPTKQHSNSPTNNQGVYGSTMYGYSNRGTNKAPFVFSTLSDLSEFTFPYSKDEFLAVRGSSGTNLISDEALEFLYAPRIQLAFMREQSPTPRTSDLAVLATNLTTTPVFSLHPAVNELLITWTFDCPKTDWEQNKWMNSLPDLANATVYLSSQSEIVLSMMPVSGTVTFDRTTLILTNFSNLGFWQWHSCKLPSKQEILGKSGN